MHLLTKKKSFIRKRSDRLVIAGKLHAAQRTI